MESINVSNEAKLKTVHINSDDDMNNFNSSLDLKSNVSPQPEKETFTGAELYNLNSHSIPTLIDPIIPSTGIWSIVGSSDTGKSMLLRQLVLNLVKEKDFIGFNINSKYKKAIFISTEDDAISTSYLIRKQSTSSDNLINIRFHFDTDNIITYLHNELTANPADIIIIDAWSDVFGQNLNDTNLIRQTLNQYRSIANKFKCSIGILHHTGKRTEKLEPSKNNILSGQGFEAKMRLVMELRTDLTDENIKHLCIVKGNYLSKEYKQSSFVLEFDPTTFSFTNTGRRIPFDELAAPVEQTGKKKGNTAFYDIEEATHRELLRTVFKLHKKHKYAELWRSLGNHYAKKLNETFGRDRSQFLLKYLLEENLIIKTGPDKASIYEIN